MVSDFEGFLRTAEAVASMDAAGVTLIEQYPRSSQDLEPVENCWSIIRQSATVETRGQFIERLAEAVAWMSHWGKQADILKELWVDQKERDRKVLAAKPPGRRIKK